MANPGPASAGFVNSVLALSTGPLSRVIAPLPLTGTAAATNGSFGLQYYEALYPVSASRLDALYNMSYASAATTATAGIVISAYAGIYTTFQSTNTAGSTNALTVLSTGSATQTFSFVSQATGATQLSVAGIRPVSVPINVNMSPGEYYIGFAVSSTNYSTGTATTSVAFSMSNLLGGSNQSAVAYAEITAATNSTSNLWGYQGLYTSSVSAVPQSIAQSLIAQTGTNQAAGQFAFVLRNY